MDLFIAICGFVGSWLLVAGPIYQAALELKDEDFKREHFVAFRNQDKPKKKISAWWWLIPPVKIILEKRRNDEYRHNLVSQLAPEDVEAMVSFISKASAWTTVAAGGLLIATKETYELAERFHLETGYFWLVVIFMVVFCLGNIVSLINRGNRIMEKFSNDTAADRA